MHSFDINVLFVNFRYHLFAILGGLILTAAGIFFYKNSLFPQTKVEILSEQASTTSASQVVVEVSGSVIKPGVYKLSGGARIEDLLSLSGGFSANADRVWADKYLNRAAKLTDGQKVFIPSIGDVQDKQSGSLSASLNGGDQNISTQNLSDSSSLVNINTASLSELDTLPGIGQVYGQNIIEHRPYSTAEELVSKGAIRQSLYDKIKNRITIY